MLCVGAVGALFNAHRESRPRGALVQFAVAVGLMGLLYAADAQTVQGWRWNGLDRSLKFALVLLALAAVINSLTDLAGNWALTSTTLGNSAVTPMALKALSVS